MLPTPRTCVICEGPLRDGGPVCGDGRCRWKFDSTPVSQRCSVCGRPLAIPEVGLGHCAGRPACRVAFHMARQRDRFQLQSERLKAARELALPLRDRGAAGALDPGAYPLALIPFYRAAVTDLPVERQQAIRDRLISFISQAEEDTDEEDEANPRPPPDWSPEVDAVLGQACGVCRGKCCRTGRDHAYLSPAVIRRYRLAHPEQGPEQVLEAYLAHIGPQTMEGSCVYHTATGCTLPRDMRSRVCNDYFCPELNDLRSDDPARAFVAAVQDETTNAVAPIFGTRLVAAAFIDATGTRPVPVPAEEGRE